MSRISTETGSRTSSKTSLALGNLRAFTILLVVSFHSVLAYLAVNGKGAGFKAR